MRLTKLPTVLSLLLAGLIIPTPPLRTQETDASSKKQGGDTPRSSADKYKTHAAQGDVSVGAELLTRKEIAKDFVADVNRCCLVVEVAVYPSAKEPLKLSHDDFALVIESPDGSSTLETPQKPATLSAKISNASNGGVTTAASVGVGVEFGTYTDPVTGQQEHGHAVTTSASVGIGTGSSAPSSTADRERENIERELGEKSLPEAKISVPVSGYLYFLLPKQKKDTQYRLEYEIKGATLPLPLS
jgi:hypothetical protein